MVGYTSWMGSDNLMKLLLTLFLLLATPALAQNTPPGSNISSGFYNKNGKWAALTQATIGTLTNIVVEYFQAAQELYLITQGLEIDPRFFGAACNTQLFAGSLFGSPAHQIHTTSGSPIISISNYTFNSATAGPGHDGDVGKVVSPFGGGCGELGTTTYIASVNTGANTATLGANMIVTCSADGNASIKMGGYPSDFSTPSLAIDDTTAIHNASVFKAIFTGGEVLLPPRCMVHNLQLQTGTALVGHTGGTNYASNISGGPYAHVTPLYFSFTGYADDVDLATGAARNGGIVTGSSTNVRLSNIDFIGGVFPYLGYFAGVSAACVSHTNTLGQLGATDLNVEHIFLDHNTFHSCPIGYGSPEGLNFPVVFVASIAGTTMTVTSITSGPFPGTNIPFGKATAWLAVGRCFTGAGVTANTCITRVPAQSDVGDYTINNSQTIGSETMTSTPPNYFTSGRAFGNEFVSNGIGINGDLSDFEATDNIFTGNFQGGWYMGPSGGSAGTGANRISGGRFEENNGSETDIGALTFDGGGSNFLTGVHFQFNGNHAIVTKGTGHHIGITSGSFQGNGVDYAGVDEAQVLLGGTWSNISFDGVQGEKQNFSAGGTSGYFLENATGSTIDTVSVNGGDLTTSFNTAFYSTNTALPTHYVQNTVGLPNIDTSIVPTVTGCSNTTKTGGIKNGSVLSGSTSTCTLTLGSLPAAPNGWNCWGNDTTSGVALTQTATATTSCALTGAMTSGDLITYSGGPR